MTRNFNLRCAIVLAAVAVVGVAGATDAIAGKSACKKGRAVIFTQDAWLTEHMSGGIRNCWVSAGDLGEAKKLSKAQNDCWVESYGACTRSDEGWVRVRKIRAAR